MGLKRITAPTLEVVSLSAMKAHLRVDHSDEDATIQALTSAAVDYLDGQNGVLGWCIGAQQWLLTYDAFPDGPIRLPLGPLVSVDSVKFADGTLQTLPDTEYEVDATDGRAWLVPVSGWPAVSGVNAAQITFTVGHTTAAGLHQSIPMIVKLMVAHWFEDRAAGPIPASADALINAIRWVHL